MQTRRGRNIGKNEQFFLSLRRIGEDKKNEKSTSKWGRDEASDEKRETHNVH